MRSYYAASRPVPKRFFESVVNVRSVEERRKWLRIGRQRDPGTWEMIPSEVRVFKWLKAVPEHDFGRC